MTQRAGSIGVLTSGGDAPGMNAAIRSVVRSGVAAGFDVVGIQNGFHGLLNRSIVPLGIADVGGVLDRGGTFLGTSRSARFQEPEGTALAAEILKDHGVAGLVVIGGDGSYRGAKALSESGIATIGIPGTIDNDVSGTDTSIGFDTALNTICDAVSKVRDTASSHERTFVIEVMGRSCGLLATYSGVACGADCILVPEVEWTLGDICGSVMGGISRGKKHSIIVISEGAGHAFALAEELSAACGQKVRAVVLGHVQRGGSPSAFDRILASRMGARAVQALADGESAVAVGLVHSETVTYPLPEAYACQHTLRPSMWELANILAR